MGFVVKTDHERLRLLQVVHGYPPAIGGVESSTRDLCEALVAEHAFDVTVATTNAFTITAFHDKTQETIPITPGEVQEGVKVLRFPFETRWSGTLRHAQRVAWRLRLPGNDRLRTWFNGPRSKGLREAVRSMKADVICAASFPLNHMHYPFERPEPQPPVVLVVAAHTNDAWGFERPNLLRLTRLAYATVAHTAHERDWLVARGAPADRVRVIGHGIDPDALRPRPGVFRAEHGIDQDGFLVAFVGQQGRHKGLDSLLAAFSVLLEVRSDAWLAIAGGRTAYSEELERQVAALPHSVRERVRIATDLSEQQKADVLGDCDVFASPSAAESFGITTLEAWSLNKPVVVSDLPSQRCVVDDGITGLLVPYGEVTALSAALLRLTDDRLRRALGEAGRARLVRRHRRQDVEQSYADLFREAAASGPVRSRSSG